MNYFQKKLWIAWRKLQFLMLPSERRVRLEVSQDGRQWTFLLVSLYEAGYGVHVFGHSSLFRELILLRKSAPIPFVVGGRERKCGISMSDRKGDSFQFSDFSNASERPSTVDPVRSTNILLDYDYFSGLTMKCTKKHEKETEVLTTEDTETTTEQRGRCKMEQPKAGPKGDGTGANESKMDAGACLDKPSAAAFSNLYSSEIARNSKNASLIRSADATTSHATSYSLHVTAPGVLRMPYFMHPSVYHKGLHKKVGIESERGRKRRFRIGFFGTHDPEFYSKQYHFPGLNRTEILTAFLSKFRNQIKILEGSPDSWPDAQIVVAMDERGGDRIGKSFLSQADYFEAMRECDFVLSPPGWCMPVSHNLIEAMFCEAIPITNARSFMAEELVNGETCLEFQDEKNLVAVIKEALAMDANKVQKLRCAVQEYYERFLAPKAFAEELGRSNGGSFFVNAEENSVRLVFPRMVFE